MKKFICCIFACLLTFCFTGCSNQIVILVKENMSDLRINYFSGASANMYANISCGYREQDFFYDGVSTKKLECGVLSLGFNTIYSYSTISIVLNINEEEKEYVLNHSPFENLYMVDIEKILSEDDKISLRLKNGEEIIDLINQSKDWKIQYDKAITIAVNYLKDELNKIYFNGKLNAEGYLKIIAKKDFDNIYWYFSYYDIFGNSNNVLIDINSGQVISNK